ncbi:hypothetical protein [Flavobacterium notoginsengisoli]|uniref:hypothetical protein n=1 Tax=Flavobacterium notoginsengisoli TaxID=1478199 RepID=UPI00362C9802
MAKSEFSETQFVFGFLNELHSRSSAFGYSQWSYFMFPSTSLEKDLPVDFFVDFYSHSEYYQFKRSDYLFGRRGAAEIKSGLTNTYLPYYRFHIYNKASTRGGMIYPGQFEMLRKLASTFPTDRVYYCAPCFHNEFDFHNYFQNRLILANSIVIDCSQFNQTKFFPPNFDINDGDEHYMIYKLSTNGYICSQTQEISIQKAEKILEYSETRKDGNFLATLNTLYNEIYLNDGLDNIEKLASENIINQIILVQSHLIQNYNIIWNPILK